ncbi:MAG: enolase C-terminal domain-like protein [Anaerolineales bacterium]|jgi:L-alanine-DL-glutamate epimerase-like enolase superfamily enzyme
MQITQVEVTPVELELAHPVRTSDIDALRRVSAIFVRFITQSGISAWGCTVAHPVLNGTDPESALEACYRGAALVPDLHPTQLEYSLEQLAGVMEDSPSALCAFDLAYHDLLGYVSGLPLFRLLGGYRSRIPTSATLPLDTLTATVERAGKLAAQGYRILKVKGGLDAQQDVQTVRALRRAMPGVTLRLDPDGGYDIRQALLVAQELDGEIEMLEQPTAGTDPAALGQVSRQSPVPILADQCADDPASALEVAAQKLADGICIKVGACGGIRPAEEMNTLARVAGLRTMVSCLIEPAMLIAAGLGIALSSPNVAYCDLDGYLDLENDPSVPGFRLEDGELIASEAPGLGCRFDLGR